MTSNLGPGPAHRSETTSAATPVGSRPGRHFGAGGYARPLAGLGTVVAIAAIVALAIALFRGSFNETVPVTVISDRAGLVMNPDAKVKMRGVQVGQVSSIEEGPDGTATLHLAMDKAQLHLIPSNVGVDITSSTVFGAKFVQLLPPDDPSPEKMRDGQVLQGEHVTVEINTVFQRLVQVLDKIDPAKLNETLGAIAAAFNGRGEKIGQTASDFNAWLAKIEPSLPNLAHDIEAAVPTLNAYADAAPDLITTAEATTRISNSLVDEQENLDAFLVSAIGLADIGNEVVGGNRQALGEVSALARAHHRRAQPLQPVAVVRHRGTGRVREISTPSVAGRADVGQPPDGNRALSLSERPAEGRRQGSPILSGTGSARGASRVPGAGHRLRYRRQPLRIR